MSRTCRLVRSSRRTPSCCSSDWICWLSPGCVDVQSRRGPAEVQLLGDGDEIADQAELGRIHKRESINQETTIYLRDWWSRENVPPMLALLGVATIVVLLAAIMSGRVSPLVALIVVPVARVARRRDSGCETGKFVTTGVQNLAPVVGMFVFAILFFGIVTDAGMFDPVIDGILRVVGTHPTWIALGTFVLAALVHLDGSGAVTFLVVVPAMLPLYERLGMDRRVLAAAVALGAGVMNVLPWGGPTLRAAAALHVPVATLYRPARARCSWSGCCSRSRVCWRARAPRDAPPRPSRGATSAPCTPMSRARSPTRSARCAGRAASGSTSCSRSPCSG